VNSQAFACEQMGETRTVVRRRIGAENSKMIRAEQWFDGRAYTLVKRSPEDLTK